MRSGSTVRASISAEVISWIAIVIAGLILIAWLFRSGSLAPAEQIEAADKDLIQLQLMLDAACASQSYRSTWNPLLDQGELVFSGTEACIVMKTGDSKVTRCIKPVCDTGLTGIYELSGITEIRIEKDQGMRTYGR
jgi:hypothetical protein